MELLNGSFLKFDRQFPVYNFFFPAQGKTAKNIQIEDVYNGINELTDRALYFHIPFCETICTFCPFTRGKYTADEQIDIYVDALLMEIELKARAVDLKKVPVAAIFFGGGTPSLLKPKHIRQIGASIHNHFDLSRIREFSFEFEVKSVNKEVADAARDIGVTHARFGLQTLSEKWARLFTLTRSEQQIHSALEILKSTFPIQSFDLLYGMNGQKDEEVIQDLEGAVRLGTTNIDVYPIDNIMSQPKLHRLLENESDIRTSATRKLSMTILVNQVMRTSGFMPHNGHGYVRTAPSPDVVSREYDFVYHEAVYGYHTFDLMGFGTNAISSTIGHVITNTDSRSGYIKSISEGRIPFHISTHSSSLDYARPLVLRLPYHGQLSKEKVKWDMIPEEIMTRYVQLREAGLFSENETEITITQIGWFWYVNSMYYMMPKDQRTALNAVIHQQLKSGKRKVTSEEVAYRKVARGG
jgi:oxygen-independent coproporphyrinogen-3 oxidase